MIKLLASWDIKPGQESDYFEFTVKEFAPGVMKLGLKPSEAWYTVYGGDPQILMGFVTEDIESMKQAINSAEWHALHQKLLEFVTDYKHKVVRSTSRFQLL